MTTLQQAQYESKILNIIDEVTDFANDLESGVDYTRSDLQGMVQAIVMGIIHDAQS